MKAIILAGGVGTRLWPLSRESYPKQFLKLNKDNSLLQQTIDNISGFIPAEDIIIVTNRQYLFHVKSDLKNSTLGIENIILEPRVRNTAPAIAFGAKYCLEKLKCNPEEVVFAFPSDHVIKPKEKFLEYLKKAASVAKSGLIVTFSIRPIKPETGYGYIKIGKKIGECFEVEKFIEKPDYEQACKYLKEGDYFWNAGIFSFRIDTILEEIKRYSPEIYKNLDGDFEEVQEKFENMPNISIDYAVMEKSDKVVTVPMDIYWNDVGCWDFLYEALEKDNQGNAKVGDIIDIDTKDCLILADKRLVTTIGLKDLLIIETADAVLIANRGETQKVKDLVNILKKKGRKEFGEHTTSYRPWGNYTVLEEGKRYKIKKITVYPGERLSLQMHHHRSEHWIVVRGTARIRIGDEERFIHENESTYVPKSTLHRLENPGKIPLELIEVQNGEYVEEDDIIRFDDQYGRD